MRVIAGRYRGFGLVFPRNRACRPTQDRAKEAWFNMIQGTTSGSNVLDLFCGTGSLGIEALSRGAEHVVFVDKEISFVKRNIHNLNDHYPDNTIFKKTTLIKAYAELFLKRFSKQAGAKNKGFDLIFMAPPWADHESYTDSLKAISEFGILDRKGIIVCEHSKAFQITVPEGLEVKLSRVYGDTNLTVLQSSSLRGMNNETSCLSR
ncbi:16S rRNA (guanine(966)-N(2))-methyltransferase RsmD [Thermoproteota archaeon]